MSEVLQRSTEEVEFIANQSGLIVIYPTDYELLIDEDDAEDSGYERRTKVIASLAMNEIHLTDEMVTVSKSGKTHRYMRMSAKMPVELRIGLQAALGSDPVKEALSIQRLHFGAEKEAVTVLFETPKMAKNVEVWRKKGRAAEVKRLMSYKPTAQDLLDDDTPF